jgi:aryl-alcohol dehydrogenase-like predicted oxidoreductase
MTPGDSKAELKLGLGCSRLGSVNGLDRGESKVLISTALDLGIRFFDTSSIYGQGDSERSLGDVIGNRQDCVICTKGGKYLPFAKRILVPAKRILRLVTRRSKSASKGVAAAREAVIPTQWDEKFLISSIEGSLRRLRRDCIDVFLLHSAPAEVLDAGLAVGALARAKESGKLKTIGASIDDVAAAKAALRDERIRIIQVPLRPGDTQYDEVLDEAQRKGVAVMAREVLGGKSTVLQATDRSMFVKQRMIDMVGDPRVSVVLVGTTNATHLKDAVRNASVDVSDHRRSA